jgi:glycosyltransferase involved in cell wall biosynthesis
MFISVLMAVYNGEMYLREAIDSILQQSYTNFEFIIVNDGSTDSTAAILRSYTDPRIRILHAEKNCGLIDSLNKGVAAAKGDYIARIDADDIAMPDRFARQVAYLQANPAIVLLGTGATIFGDNLVEKNMYYQHSNACISMYLLFRNVFIHSSIMVKTEVLQEFPFEKEYYLAEDYMVWVKIAQKYKTACIKDALVRYREHETNITKVKYDRHRETVYKIYAEQLQRIGIQATTEQLLLHNKLGAYQLEESMEFLQATSVWLLLLLEQNQKYKIYPMECLKNRLLLLWVDACLCNKSIGVTKLFMTAKISSYLPWWRRINIAIKLL